MQEIIVAIIGVITLVYIAKSIYKQFKPKPYAAPDTGCSGCSGCDLKNHEPHKLKL